MESKEHEKKTTGSPNVEVYDVEELAALWKLSKQTIKVRLRAGELKGFKMGRGWRILKSDADDYRNERIKEEQDHRDHRDNRKKQLGE